MGSEMCIRDRSKTVGGTSGPTDDPGTLARAWHTRTLYREVQAIRRRGAAVLVLQPTAGELAGRAALADRDPQVHGPGASDRSEHGLDEIAEAARVSALARLALPEATRARRLLASASDPRR